MHNCGADFNPDPLQPFDYSVGRVPWSAREFKCPNIRAGIHDKISECSTDINPYTRRSRLSRQLIGNVRDGGLSELQRRAPSLVGDD